MNSQNRRSRIRSDWQKQLTPLLDSLMQELCHSQQAIVGRNLESLETSIRRQIVLANEILEQNQRLAASPASRLGENDSGSVREPDLSELHVPPACELGSAEAEHVELNFRAATGATQHQAKVTSALLRRSVTTLRALGNLFALGADTYQRPNRPAEIFSNGPAQPSRGVAEGQ